MTRRYELSDAEHVAVVRHPVDAVAPTFTQFGFGEHIAQLVQQMYAGYADGLVAHEGIPQRGTTSITTTLRKMLSSGAPTYA